MNWLDYTILAIITIGVLNGAIRGFIHGIFRTCGIILAIIIGKKYYGSLANLLIENTAIEEMLMDFIQNNKVVEAFSFVFPPDGGLNNIYQFIAFVIINCISIFILFIGARICIALLEALLNEIFSLPVLSFFNHSFGAILGLVNGVLIILFLFAMLIPLASIEKFGFIYRSIDNSLLAKYFYQYNFIFNWILDSATDLFLN